MSEHVKKPRIKKAKRATFTKANKAVAVQTKACRGDVSVAKCEVIIGGDVYTGPSRNLQKIINITERIGFRKVSSSVSWREAFSEFSDEELPGAALAGARYREGLTQRELSALTGIPQRHISEMENGKRPIGKTTAKKLAAALNVGYKVFL